MNIYQVTLVEEGSITPYSTTFGTAHSVTQAGLLALAVEAPEEDEQDLGLMLFVQSVIFIAECEFGSQI